MTGLVQRNVLRVMKPEAALTQCLVKMLFTCIVNLFWQCLVYNTDQGLLLKAFTKEAILKLTRSLHTESEQKKHFHQSALIHETDFTCFNARYNSSDNTNLIISCAQNYTHLQTAWVSANPLLALKITVRIYLMHAVKH